MTYAIYGARGSGSGIIEAVCAELGVDYEARYLDVRAGENQEEAYRKLHPLGKLPTLVFPDGEVVTDTVAIILTLDERHPQSSLLPPAASKARARALRWLLFCATELYPLIEIVDFPERFAGSDECKDVVRTRAGAIWRNRWQPVEDAVAGSPYLLSEGFCATDVYIAILCHWDMDPDWRQKNLARVEALSEAVRNRPALVPVFERHKPDETILDAAQPS
ncbi:glutathione S-transferase family protein [Mesorhizobium sp. CO1-1-8]|uniref:glutathione S-transferase family protein n=1 Tax=Mesorhizobium sp. CO1-1-8 TaxID=2876631 RepID=UPI001CD16FF0|nr:glutathione S-transferase family protein [Mesorhizobium sp. CO1-1-8]MBZ9770985.1 glutathione S-transferase family protein [Mesorhizobium sp. CO1-1-8]